MKLKLLYFFIVSLAIGTATAANAASQIEFKSTIENVDADGIAVTNSSKFESGEATGDDVVGLFHHITISGTVTNDVCMLGGTLDIGPDAKIKGNVFALGTLINIAPKAVIKGDLLNFCGKLKAPADFRPGGDLQDWPVSLKRLIPAPSLLSKKSHGAWISLSIFFLIMILLYLLFPVSLQKCTDTTRERPLASLFAGFLVFLALGPALLLLVLTIVGILLIPLVIFAVLIALLFGITGAYLHMGCATMRLTGRSVKETPLVALAVGTLVVCALLMVPVLSWALPGLLVIIGLGSATLALAEHMKRGKQPQAVPTVTPPPQDGQAQQSQTSSALPVTDPSTMPHAGFWIRAAAGLIDTILLSFMPSFTAILLVYVVGMWTWKGATIGNMIFGIKVVRSDGQPVSLGVALVRGLACLLSLCAMGLGFFWIAFDREKQAWHDKIAGTYVVRMPKGVSLV